MKRIQFDPRTFPKIGQEWMADKTERTVVEMLQDAGTKSVRNVRYNDNYSIMEEEYTWLVLRWS